jgi:hypothetical protein
MDGRARGIDRNRLLGNTLGLRRQGISRALVFGVVLVEERVRRMGQLQTVLVQRDLAGEDAAHAWLQQRLPPGLVEERERNEADAVGDRHLENRARARLHLAQRRLANLGHDGDVLVDRQAIQRRQLTPAGVAARVVREQVGDGHEPERLLDRRRRAAAEKPGELGVELGSARVGHPLILRRSPDGRPCPLRPGC